MTTKAVKFPLVEEYREVLIQFPFLFGQQKAGKHRENTNLSMKNRCWDLEWKFWPKMLAMSSFRGHQNPD